MTFNTFANENHPPRIKKTVQLSAPSSMAQQYINPNELFNVTVYEGAKIALTGLSLYFCLLSHDNNPEIYGLTSAFYMFASVLQGNTIKNAKQTANDVSAQKANDENEERKIHDDGTLYVGKNVNRAKEIVKSIMPFRGFLYLRSPR